MKIMEIGRGMGNQLFQYALARSLSEHFDQEVILDVSWFDRKQPEGESVRFLSLDHWNTTLKMSSDLTLRDIGHYKLPFHKWMRNWCSQPKYPFLYVDRGFFYQPEVFTVWTPVTYYIGSFQSEKYFKPMRSTLLKELTLKDVLDDANQRMIDQIRHCSGTSVSLHVRRGDYVGHPVYAPCPIEYYHRAIQFIRSKVKHPHFFIFSNDLEWSQQHLHLRPEETTYIDINSEEKGFYDLELMKNCQHHIISNSSFSWWGAWLHQAHQHEAHHVVAPREWFPMFKDRNTDDLVPRRWTRL